MDISKQNYFSDLDQIDTNFSSEFSILVLSGGEPKCLSNRARTNIFLKLKKNILTYNI